MSHRDMWPISLSLISGTPTPSIVDKLSVTFYFGVSSMEEIKLINDVCLLTELLNTFIPEKNDVLWVVPYHNDLHEHIVDELFSKHPVSWN